jgi:predicted AAA+ superfamily ATPase
VRYPEVLERLATYLLDNFAQEYNASRLAEMLGVSDHTINTYCHYLQEAFLLLSVHKFSYKSSERIRAEKMYAIDNAFISNRQNTFSTENIGWRLENAVYVELRHRADIKYADVFYYNDRSFEVDFLVAKSGVVEELYQVCYDMSNDKTRKREINSILQGAKKFHCNNLTIITFAENETLKQNDYTIKVVSADKWMLYLQDMP